MSGPWEQYQRRASDAPASAGPWAQYAEPASPAPGPASVADQPGMLANAVAGLVRGAGSIGATLLAPVDAAARAVGVQNDFIGRNDRRQAMDGGLQELGADPNSTAYQVGKVASEVAGTLPVGGALGKVVGALAPGATGAALATSMGSGGFRTGAQMGTAANLATRAVGGAVAGAGSAALVDPEQAGMGAVVGGVLPGALQATRALTRAAGGAVAGTVGAGKAIIDPLRQTGREALAGQTLRRVAGADADAVAQRLAQAQPVLPGSAPTAAQVAENGGIAAMERAAAAREPAEFADRAINQSAARAAAVSDIAGDAGKRELFETARNSTAKDLYDRAFSVPLEAGDLSPALRGEVTKLMRMPAVAAAMKVARQNASNHGMKLGGDGSVMGLHQAKLAMDDMISEISGGTGAQANKARAIEAARDRLVTFMQKISPDYGEARATYAAMSKPINQMDVGQRLYDTLKPALSDSGALGKESSAAYARALRDSDATVKTATGRTLKFDQVMEPAQAATLKSVAEDLARTENARNLGRGVGSDTFQKLVLGNIAEQSGSPLLTKIIMQAPLVSRVSAGLAGGPEKQIQSLLAQALLNPRDAAVLMQKAVPGGMGPEPVSAIARSLAAARGATTSAVPAQPRDAYRQLFYRAAPVAVSDR